MKLLRILLSLVCLFVLGRLTHVVPAFAADEFSIRQKLFYNLDQLGTAEVTHEVELTNLLSQVYAKEYSLSLETARLFSPSAFSTDGTPIETTTSHSGSVTTLRLIFPDPVVGRNKTNRFTIKYRLENLARKSGLVWEVNFPKISDLDSLESFDLTLSVPESLGTLSFVSPRPYREEIQAGKRLLYYSREHLSATSLSLVLGDIQVFNFALTYYLENPGVESAVFTIALPPDTDRQTVYYQNIIPPPRQVSLDPDGNWLAEYEIDGGRNVDITATGSVKIFPGRNPHHPDTSATPDNVYLQSQPYWPATNPVILQEAARLADAEAIYRFVINRLEYNNRLDTGGRLGALEALRRPHESTCTEFTDLFIALCRAKGIPAREINGFAYTADTHLQELSQNLDVLHSWPEYWNETLAQWQPVDPTWEKTTGGLDYFNKFDLNHFAFAIHGRSDTQPLPAGAYKSSSNLTKGVQVIFGSSVEEPAPDLAVDITLSDRVLPAENTGKIKVANLTGTALYNLPVSLSSAKVTVNQSPPDKITVLPPFGSVTLPFSYRSSLLSFGGGEISAAVGPETATFSLSPVSFSHVIFPVIVISILTFSLMMLTISFRKRHRS